MAGSQGLDYDWGAGGATVFLALGTTIRSMLAQSPLRLPGRCTAEFPHRERVNMILHQQRRTTIS